MYCIIDFRAPGSVKNELRKNFIVFELRTTNIVYEAISGHPDIFIAQIKNKNILAPNSPDDLVNFFKKNNLPFEFGYEKLGGAYPGSAKYNISCGDKVLICNAKICDKKILEMAESLELKIIDVKQGYVRCNAIHLNNDKFIISDKGIQKSLEKNNIEFIYVDSLDVYLPGVKHGFFPGCCGIFDDVFYIAGKKIDFYENKNMIINFIKASRLRAHVFDCDYYYDIGGILFVNKV